MRYLVTGGAGYVGSHTVLALVDAGHQVVVLDNFQTGHRWAIPAGVVLEEGDLTDTAFVDRVLARGPWDAVFHFASLSLVAESMQKPLLYLDINMRAALCLIEACVRHGVKKFIFSSTASVFQATSQPITEESAVEASSPYGESKFIIERALVWADRIYGLRSATLRYFNAAGADPQGRAGEDHRPETHLIPLAIDAALGRSGTFFLHGDDYPTPDGTCIRDYVHVTDIARAHLLVLHQIEGRSVLYNIGNGRGYSNLEVIRSVERVTGSAPAWQKAPRRPGDPPMLVASPARFKHDTGWEPLYSDLDEIVRTAYTWRKKHFSEGNA